jgi:hypothetical protein
MRADRLLLVAKALRESPDPSDFTMDIYAHSCGSPACALGHYAHRRDLQDKVFLSEFGFLRPARGRHIDFNAFRWAQKHFEIEKRAVDELFDAGGCGNAQTALEAALYIEDFVARTGGA